MKRALNIVAITALTITGVVPAAAEMKQGKPDLKSAGPLAFGPEGVLFVGDPQSAAIFAIDTKPTVGDATNGGVNIDGVDAKVAAALGTTPDDVLINDMAVNPENGVVFLSVSRGRGPDAMPVLLTFNGKGDVTEFALDDVRFAKLELPNAPEDKVVGEGRRRRNNRLEAITDLLFLDGKLYIAGLSNEEFASKLRSIPFPFEPADSGTSIEIFHGSHGQLETRSPVRTFAAVEIDGTPHLLAAYTCTPLVKIPIKQLQSGEKVRGATIAELGNRNRPLDMIVYQKDGKEFVLMANSERGMMKIPMEGVADATEITQPVDDKAGVEYETLDGIEGVVQLDRLNSDNVLLLVQQEAGINLKTMAMP
jgi:hypothetical protein